MTMTRQLGNEAPGTASADPRDPQYYAARGASAVEAQMRADRMHLMALLAETAQAVDRQEQDRLADAVAAVEHRWAAHVDADMQADWEYLSTVIGQWQSDPEGMARLYAEVVTDLADGLDAGVLPAQWRSVCQAREITGHGPWSEVRDPFGEEAARSRSYLLVDQANPTYHGGRRAASWNEQLMRADFARVHQLRRQRGRARTDLDYQQITEHMYAICQSWADRPDDLGGQWRLMRTLIAGTNRNDCEFADAINQIMEQHPADDGLTDRSINQVCELMQVPRPAPTADASGVTANVASSAFARARTAQLAHLNNRRGHGGGFR